MAAPQEFGREKRVGHSSALDRRSSAARAGERRLRARHVLDVRNRTFAAAKEAKIAVLNEIITALKGGHARAALHLMERRDRGDFDA